MSVSDMRRRIALALLAVSLALPAAAADKKADPAKEQLRRMQQMQRKLEQEKAQLTQEKTELDGKLLKPAVDQLATADPDRSGPLIGPYPAFQDILQGALEEVLFSGGDVNASLTKAENDATTLLEDYNG